MRKIDEIITELVNHPDYITSNIYTWSNFISETNESLRRGGKNAQTDHPKTD